jgi:hypothetical protein
LNCAGLVVKPWLARFCTYAASFDILRSIEVLHRPRSLESKAVLEQNTGYEDMRSELEEKGYRCRYACRVESSGNQLRESLEAAFHRIKPAVGRVVVCVEGASDFDSAFLLLPTL